MINTKTFTGSNPHENAFVSYWKVKLTVFSLLMLLSGTASFSLNVTIIESQSNNPGHDMDLEWSSVLSGMGHSPVILPQSTLDNNAFFANTDILIVSSGVIALPPNRVNTILQFMQTGKPVYLQSEYLATMGGNIAFESILTSLGATFSWGANFSGDLQPMNVLGTYATTNNIVPSIGYFWYSVAGYGDCNLINMLEYGGAYHGFQYIPTNPAYGSIITTTDQDWVRATTSPQLMQNIITHLINPGQTSNGPPISLGNDTTLCPGSVLTLDATSANATYLWQNNSTNPTFNVTQSGVYWVQVSANGCISTDTIVVNYTTLPVVTLGNDTTLCDGESVVLNATTPNASYLWQDNSTNPTFSVTQSGTYYVTVANVCGTTSDTVLVSFFPLPVVALGNDTTLCQGESVLLDATLPNATYLWQDNTTNPTYLVTQQGVYEVEVTVNGCTAEDSVQVNFNPLPVVNLGIDQTICQGQTLILDATTTNGTYLWQDNSTGSQLTVTQSGTYWVAVTVSGCTTIDSVQVTVNPLPVVNLGTDLTLCQGETITFDASTANGIYLWQDASTGPSIVVSQPGLYWVQVTVDGCSSVDSVLVNYNPLPVVNLGADQTLCQGESLLLDATASGATYLWQDNSSGPVFSVTQQGTYWVQVTINNCSAVDSVNVIYNPLPVINLGNDFSLCQGETAILNAGTAGGTYLWQDNSTNPDFSVTQQGIYWVEVTVNNCSAIDSISVTYNALPVFSLGSDVTLCEGETLTLDATTPNASYLWQDNSTNSVFTVTVAGIYYVTVTVNGCSSADTLAANYNALPIVNLGNDTIACKGEPFLLDVTNTNATYLWQDNSTSATYLVTAPGTYSVTVTSNNCIASDEVIVEFSNCNVVLEMPNIFTPNQDGSNDTFIPIRMDGITRATLTVFDRWGIEVFNSANLSEGWDGKYKGSVGVDGTYLWVVEYATIKNESLNQKGTVMLLK